MRKSTNAAVIAAAIMGVAMTYSIGARAQAPQGGRGAGPGAQAQQPPAPPQRIQVTVNEIRPEMIGAYDELIKNDAIPAFKKAGLPWRWMWTSVTGAGFTRISIQPIANYAEFDQPGALQRALGPGPAATYGAMVRSMLTSTHTDIETLNVAQSIQSGMTAPPPLAVLQVFTIAQGKNADFNASMTMDFLPALKKAGVKDFWVYNTNFGGNGEIVTVRPVEKFAALDGNLFAAANLPMEVLQQMFAKRAATVTNVATDIIRLLPDLSYGMPGGPAQ